MTTNSYQESYTASAQPCAVVQTPTIELRVFSERILVRCDDEWTASFKEAEMPVLALSFRYGRLSVPAGDHQVLPDPAIDALDRDHETEERARRLLESLGAIELACVDHYEPAFDSVADYVIEVGGDVHSYCSFGAYALPQLRALGWKIEVGDDYPYPVLSGNEPWYAAVEGDEERPDWFGFELGVFVDGKRLSMLPALVELLDRSPDEGSLSALLNRPLRYYGLPTGDGAFVPVPAERLSRLVSVLSELYDGPSSAIKDGQLECPASRAAAFAGLEGALGDEGGCGALPVSWSGAELIRQRSEALTAPLTDDVAPPAGLKATLRGYQLEGVSWLQRLRKLGVSGVLADDMGLGKTLQTIAHVLIEKQAGRLSSPCLIVAPTSLVQNWEREIARFAPELRTAIFHGPQRHKNLARLDACDVIITTYPLLVRDEELFAERECYLLVLDEAQTVKNRNAKAYKAVAKVRSQLRVFLSGTPLENSLAELHAIYDLLVPGLLGRPEAFRERFARPIELGDEERLAQLRARVMPFMLRRLKQDVAPELPPKTEIVRPVDIGGAQRELYESIRVAAHAEVRKLIRRKGLAASTIGVLGAILKLRQVCCDPRLVRVAAARKVEQSAKLNVLLEMVRTQVPEGRRILIFSQFTSMLSLISEGLMADGIRHVKLTGATADRQKQVDAFQGGKADVFLISLKAGGTGLTLTNADTVIHYDPWWNPAAQAQATDRAYRIGQKRPVFVYNLIVAGSVEERIMQLQQRKRQLADAILGGRAGLSGALELEDVEDLFAPLPRESTPGR